MARDTIIARKFLDAAALEKARRAGSITPECYYARLAMLATPRVTPTPTNWRRAIFRGAARGHLSAADIASLERNKGGTEDA